MELFIIGTICLVFLFYITTRIFNKLKWNVKNYRDHVVPYSIGTVFIVYLSVDYFFFSRFVDHYSGYLYLLFVWLVGLIDDVFGKSHPKGIRGHFTLFFKKREVSTGLIKAIGVVAVSTVYLIFSGKIELAYSYLFLLFILFPHAMNLLDTKPLRVFKVSTFLIFLPMILTFQMNGLIFLYLTILFIGWGIQESFMKGMLGDNGAMLLGAFGALLANTINVVHYSMILLLLTLFITWYAEKSSIQRWVEKTPFIREIDQFGRIE